MYGYNVQSLMYITFKKYVIYIVIKNAYNLDEFDHSASTCIELKEDIAIVTTKNVAFLVT